MEKFIGNLKFHVGLLYKKNDSLQEYLHLERDMKGVELLEIGSGWTLIDNHDQDVIQRGEHPKFSESISRESFESKGTENLDEDIWVLKGKNGEELDPDDLGDKLIQILDELKNNASGGDGLRDSTDLWEKIDVSDEYPPIQELVEDVEVVVCEEKEVEDFVEKKVFEEKVEEVELKQTEEAVEENRCEKVEVELNQSEEPVEQNPCEKEEQNLLE